MNEDTNKVELSLVETVQLLESAKKIGMILAEAQAINGMQIEFICKAVGLTDDEILEIATDDNEVRIFGLGIAVGAVYEDRKRKAKEVYSSGS